MEHHVQPTRLGVRLAIPRHIQKPVRVERTRWRSLVQQTKKAPGFSRHTFTVAADAGCYISKASCLRFLGISRWQEVVLVERCQRSLVAAPKASWKNY